MATSPIICLNAMVCPIHNDGTPADRVAFGYQCQKTNNHWADATVGLVSGTFNNSTPPTYSVFSENADNTLSSF